MPHARRAGPHQKWPIVLAGTVVAAVLVAGVLLAFATAAAALAQAPACRP